MPETAALCLQVRVSRRARWLAFTARSLTGLALPVCLICLSLEPTLPRAAAALAAAAALTWALRPQRGPRLRQISVDSDGEIRARVADVDAPATLQFCSPGLICLRAAGRSVAIWPDSMATADWRRLFVCCRWPHRRSAANGRTRIAVRTK